MYADAVARRMGLRAFQAAHAAFYLVSFLLKMKSIGVIVILIILQAPPLETG